MRKTHGRTVRRATSRKIFVEIVLKMFQILPVKLLEETNRSVGQFGEHRSIRFFRSASGKGIVANPFARVQPETRQEMRIIVGQRFVFADEIVAKQTNAAERRIRLPMDVVLHRIRSQIIEKMFERRNFRRTRLVQMCSQLRIFAIRTLFGRR